MRAGILVLLLTACNAPEDACDVSYAPNMHTVLTARWTSPSPGPSWVEYDLDGTTVSTPVVDDGSREHRANLLGLEALEDVAWTLITDGDDRFTCSGVSTTENLPPQSAGLEVSVWNADLADPMPWFIGSSFSFDARPGVFVADRATGQTRWYLEGDDGAQITSARLPVEDPTLDGGVLYNQADMAREEDIGALIRVDAAGERVASVRTPWAHHVFTQLPDGTTTYLAIDGRPWYDPESGGTRLVAGDAIHEVAPDGTDTAIFTVWDWETIGPSHFWEQTLYPGYLDWTHANGIRWNEDLQTYVVTFAGLEQVWLVGRDGVPTRRFGPGTEYPPVPGVQWESPHDASILEDGELLVHLGTLERAGCHQLRIDEPTKSLVQTWEYSVPMGNVALGKCYRLDNGNTFVGFGSSGSVQEVTADGRIVWDAHIDRMAGLATTRPFGDLY